MIQTDPDFTLKIEGNRVLRLALVWGIVFLFLPSLMEDAGLKLGTAFRIITSFIVSLGGYAFSSTKAVFNPKTVIRKLARQYPSSICNLKTGG